MNKITGRFENVPLEEDTIVKSQGLAKLDGIQALHQKWVWEGIIAESIIFVDVDVTELSDKDLENLVKKNELAKPESSFTIARERNGFTFINFNFENPM